MLDTREAGSTVLDYTCVRADDITLSVCPFFSMDMVPKGRHRHTLDPALLIPARSYFKHIYSAFAMRMLQARSA